MNDVAVDMEVVDIFLRVISFSLDVYSEVELLDHMVILLLIF